MKAPRVLSVAGLSLTAPGEAGPRQVSANLQSLVTLVGFVFVRFMSFMVNAL